MSGQKEKTDLTLKLTSLFNEGKKILFKNSSDILNIKRDEAIQSFIKQGGIPTQKNENYKYTNLSDPFSIDYKFIHTHQTRQVNLKDVYKCDVPQLDTYLALIFNGWYYNNNQLSGELPEGVILESLEKAAALKPELLKKYASIAKTEDDPLVALNTAFAKDGYFIYVPKNTIVEKPIQLINFLESQSDTYATQRNFIYIDEGADLKLISCDHTLNLNRYLNNSVTEVFVGANANFEYYTLQNQHNNTTSLNSVFIQQEKDSKATTLYSTLHGGLIRNNLKYMLNGENAEANLFGMSFIDRNQHVDNFTQVIHAYPNCNSNQVYKNVLNDESTGAFSGRIHVVRNAQKTNAFQRNNNLLLTDKAAIKTKPQLIIDADDVKCSHGATVGQIDQEALFYMRARGINEDLARLMMMNAFAYEVIQQITVEPLRERINDLVDKRLKGEVARCHECAYNCNC